VTTLARVDVNERGRHRNGDPASCNRLLTRAFEDDGTVVVLCVA
jgi:hypothetical protein